MDIRILLGLWCFAAVAFAALALWLMRRFFTKDHGRTLAVGWGGALLALLAGAWIVSVLEGMSDEASLWVMFFVAAPAQGALVTNVVSSARAVFDDASVWRIMLLVAAIMLAPFLVLLFTAAATPVTVIG